MAGCVYGPVPSRRLGYSLGVDLIPHKICSFDCIYCQLGRTTKKTVVRNDYADKDEVLRQIESALSRTQMVDYISFSGCGEPTLNSAIGELIREVKKQTEIPVAVLTNSSLLPDPQVREDLLSADVVLPSLDAGQESTFQKVNRPHSSLSLSEIVAGLTRFQKEYTGRIWLELMLIKGMNDTPDEVRKLKEAISKVNPDRIQLNTVIRPPAEELARPLTAVELETMRRFLDPRAEIIADFTEKKRTAIEAHTEEDILAFLARRPATLSDILSSLGIHRNEAIKYLELLKKQNKIRSRVHRDLEYYELL
jgi:wyosine [tRNA(Phe)-imidazoG37] synthetase (radical SAM superfamily)